MKILGIDPAPAKRSVIFDGERFFEIEPLELKEFLDKIVMKDTFIGWDAPLGDDFSLSLSYKKIERILNRKDSYIDGNKPPKGISTLPFSTCPHWSISQYVTGYPIVNSEIIDRSKLKYHLVQSNNDLSENKPNLFETHPAYSIWIFLKDKVNNFKYKGDRNSKNVFKSIKEALFELDSIKEYEFIKKDITNDDRLDSFIAYLNVKLFFQKKAFVYGDRKIGAMLLPSLSGILKDEVLREINGS